MRILLVKPKAKLDTINKLKPLIFLEPLELGYLAAVVPQGHDVRILDMRLSKRPDVEFVKALNEYVPDIVGISGYTHEASKVIELSKTARKLLPKSLIVVGGHHATVLPHDYNIDSIDLIVRGEGCKPFRAILERAIGGKGFDGIQNVVQPGTKFSNEEAARKPVFPDLESMPFPRRDLWDKSIYKCVWPTESHPDWQTIFPPVSLVRTSYGCVMNCSFCVIPTLSDKTHLTRPPEKVAEEIAGLKVDHVYFCDDETFMNTEHIKSVAEEIQARGIKKRYFAWARSTTVNRKPELFRLWRSIGMDAVFLGFEATTDEELKNLSKHSTVSENEKAHKLLREMGIAVHAGFMVSPDFTEDDFLRLKNYVKRMPPAQVTFTVFTPSPGSPAWFDEKDKFVGNPYELHDCMHPLSLTKMPLRRFYKHFASLVSEGGKKNTLRNPGMKIPPVDIIKVVFASFMYGRSLKKAYRDFPVRLW